MDALSGNFEVIFSVAEAPYAPPWLAICVGVFGIVGGLVAARRSGHSGGRVLGAAVAFVALLGSTSMIWTHWEEHQFLVNAHRSGATTTLEGRVTDFRPDPWGGNVAQTFTVAGHTFEVVRADISAGFRRTVSGGGPSLSGKCVRVEYARLERIDQDRIVWLGIRRSDGCSESSPTPPARR